MQGDKLASGAPSAVFTGPRIKFDPQEMERDLRDLPAASFQEKYMMTGREYDLLIASNGDETNDLIREVREHCEAIERLTQQDKKEDESLKRECFIQPFAAHHISGRVLVSRDQPVARQTQSKLALPRRLRQQKDLLPTTGHVLAADVMFTNGCDAHEVLMGKRVLFGPMSGTAVCFQNYPTWVILDAAEILAIVNKEDAEIVEQELEPLT